MNARRTYFTYFGFLVVILAIVGYSARNVIFRPWTSRTWTTVATLHNRIFLFGGKNDRNELVRDILTVDPGANSLRRVGSDSSGLFGSGAAALDGQIFVAGGTDLHSVSSRIYRFDPASRRLTPIGDLPGPRSYGALVGVGRKLYYLGGWDGTNTSDDVIEIAPSTGATRIVAHLPQPLEQFGSAVEGNIVYLVGGMNGAGNVVRSIDGIEPQSGRVVAKGRLPTAAARMSAAVLGRSVYVAGGWDGKALNELLRFQPGRGQLTPDAVLAINFPTLDTSLAAVGTELYLIGGREERYRRQVQVLRIDPRSLEVHSLLLRSYAWW